MPIARPLHRRTAPPICLVKPDAGEETVKRLRADDERYARLDCEILNFADVHGGKIESDWIKTRPPENQCASSTATLRPRPAQRRF
jgi:hypothetical protein